MSYKTEQQCSLSAIYVKDLIRADHPYRKILKHLDLKPLARRFRQYYSKHGSDSLGPEKGILILMLQFMEDLSDRQMEAALQENVAMKFFCGYELTDKTPDHSTFGKTRDRFGTKGMEQIFKHVNKQLSRKGLIGQVFSFIDSTAIVTKVQTWDERDKAIEQNLESFNNKTAGKVKTKTDSEARFGCKGKSKYWFGYKRHVCQDAKAGIITKVAATPANVTDVDGLDRVCPDKGMLLMDKAYCGKKAQNIVKRNNCHSGAILKNNMKAKNRDKDRWLQKLRMPFEGVFAHQRKRAKYRGIKKVQGQVFMQATAWNIKRMLKCLPQLEMAAIS